MKIRKIHIENCKIFQDFDIDFLDNNGRAQSLVVVAGINGSGKTTLFRDFLYPAFRDKSLSGDSSIEVEYKKRGGDKNRHGATVAIDSGLLREKKAFDDSLTDELLQNLPNILYFEAGVPEKSSAKQTIVRFVDKLIYEQDKKSSEAYLAAQTILQSIFQDFELQVEFKGIDKDREVLFKNELAGEITIDELSNGEQELVTKAFSLYLDDVKNHIILIDEPESSLHPNWQNRIARIYQEFADKNDNQVILATHSPHIVASVRKEQIRVLAKDGQTTRAIKNFAGSYGWRVDRVLLEIFRLDGLRTPLIEKKLATLRDMVFSDRYATEEFAELEKELEATIGYDDMDLALIRLEIAKRNARDETHR